MIKRLQHHESRFKPTLTTLCAHVHLTLCHDFIISELQTSFNSIMFQYHAFLPCTVLKTLWHVRLQIRAIL